LQHSQTFSRNIQLATRGLLGFFYEDMQKHDVVAADGKHCSNNSIIQHAAYFPQMRFHFSYQWHPKWPTKLDFFDICANYSAIFQWQFSQTGSFSDATLKNLTARIGRAFCMHKRIDIDTVCQPFSVSNVVSDPDKKPVENFHAKSNNLRWQFERK
jgi:hypothetical protein